MDIHLLQMKKKSKAARTSHYRRYDRDAACLLQDLCKERINMEWMCQSNVTLHASEINLTPILDSEANHWKLQSFCLNARASCGNPKLKLDGNQS